MALKLRHNGLAPIKYIYNDDLRNYYFLCRVHILVSNQNYWIMIFYIEMNLRNIFKYWRNTFILNIVKTISMHLPGVPVGIWDAELLQDGRLSPCFCHLGVCTGRLHAVSFLFMYVVYPSIWINGIYTRFPFLFFF